MHDQERRPRSPAQPTGHDQPTPGHQGARPQPDGSLPDDSAADARLRRPGVPGQVVFLDFEASSLGRRGVPIEVAWVFESGEGEAHLIRPAPDWTDWSAEAEAVHGITREVLAAEGRAAGEVARRMLDCLSGHRLYASAPSWDGQWLSRLLRAGGLPRHALRLRDTEEAQAEAAMAALAARGLPGELRLTLAQSLLAEVRARFAAAAPAHRALEDARREMEILHELRRRAAAAGGAPGC